MKPPPTLFLAGALTALLVAQAGFAPRVGPVGAATYAALPAPDPGAFPIADPRPPSPHLVARVRRPVELRRRPGGASIATARARTEFGSPRVLSVARRRGRWLAVTVPEAAPGGVAWVRRSHGSVRFRRLATSLHADLSRRTLSLRRAGRTSIRIRVATGAPGSPTPTGRFAVTDKLRGGRFGSYYGCCVLALSGRQPSPPPGWDGGDRLAVHGTSAPGTIGTSATAGCLRARDRDLVRLMRQVPLGTPVFIRR